MSDKDFGMATISKFSVENIRCFEGKHDMTLGSMTMMVGENSTGKTTLLAVFNALVNYFSSGKMTFNDPMYEMGAFQDIVREGYDQFGLSLTVTHNDRSVEWKFKFGHLSGGFEPTVTSMEIVFEDAVVSLRASDKISDDNRKVSKNKDGYQIEYAPGALDHAFPSILVAPSIDALTGENVEAKKSLVDYMRKKNSEGEDWWLIGKMFRSIGYGPVRSKPKRVYYPTDIIHDPEGGRVLSFVFHIEKTDRKGSQDLKKYLAKFGKDSGMFENVTIKGLGGSGFEILVEIRGVQKNLVGVGYGVSQILPILIERFFVPTRNIAISPYVGYPKMQYFLLQQPEVHLHPKAQAELCSVFVDASHNEKLPKQSFVIETHSDFLVDRLRIEIMKKTINPEDASLVYLETSGKSVTIHNISFDENANMFGAPDSYREFFAKESDRLLGFKS